MKTSTEGKMFLTGLEGICLSKYLDSVGVWTIGVGATRSEIPDLAKWPIDKKIAVKEAFDLLDHSLVKYEDAVNKAVKVALLQHQFDALVSLCYNIGIGGLSKSTFVKRINSGSSVDSIVSGIMMWNKPKEIIGRRTREAKLFSDGVYAGGGKANLFPVNKNGNPIYSKGIIVDLSEYL